VVGRENALAFAADIEAMLAERDALKEEVGRLRALLDEGETSAWCDAVIGCAAEIEPKRAARFRDHFYDWRKRVRQALAPVKDEQ
jgi:hypothetical protein